MAYQSLYRKWRPVKFDDICGQDHIKTTLKKQILANKIGHAYIFTGTRGTGKTSCAKILANAVNCLSPINGEPCGTCEVCKAVSDGAFFDIMEIDAASKSSVDDVRKLIDDVMFLPSVGKYKVFIIDEVQMLTGYAFNALLKTLEEPPEHVIFILATTEIQKIPPTILSRCQRFDFKRLDISTIEDRLLHISEVEGINIKKDGLRYIAVLADGSMRDALSILEQMQTYDLIDESSVRNQLGIVGKSAVIELLEFISRKDFTRILQSVDGMYADSKKIDLLINDILEICKDIIAYKITDSYPFNNYSTVETSKIKLLAGNLTVSQVLKWTDILLELLNKTSNSSVSKSICQLSLLNLADVSSATVEKDPSSIQEFNAPKRDIQELISYENPLINEDKDSTEVTNDEFKNSDLSDEGFDDIYYKLKDVLNSDKSTMPFAAFLPKSVSVSDEKIIISADQMRYDFYTEAKRNKILSDICKNKFNMDLIINKIN